MTKRVFLVAAEPSGDLLGKEVAIALQSLAPDIKLAGIGGAEMQAAGLVSKIDTAPLSVLGLFEGLKAYPKVVELADAAANEIIAFNPNAVVLIDSWGFMLRVAQRLKKMAPHIHLIKLVGPQVWATRAGRAKTLAATVDHLLAIFEMEVPFYEPTGLKTTVIGNPALGRTKKGDGAAFRQALSIGDNEQILLVLPGSRHSEIKRIAPTLVTAAELIHAEMPELNIVFSPARSVFAQFEADFPGVRKFATVTGAADDRYNAMAAADLAIACSGTVTSELAVQGTPFLVGYKLGWITWAIARSFLYKPEFMCLLNISAGREVAPEFLQTTFTSQNIKTKSLELLKDPVRLSAQSREQNEIVHRMGANKRSAADLAAEAIWADLQEL